LVAVAVGLGMTKVRLTGGEPLVRKDIDHLVARIGAIRTAGPVDDDERLGSGTTCCELRSLRPEPHQYQSGYRCARTGFERIARRGNLSSVMEGIAAAQEAGLTPLKLNCVVMRGWTRTRSWISLA